MNETIKCQGRQLASADLIWLQNWIAEHVDWSRARLAKELCGEWNWRTASGQIKNYAARSFLIKLEQRALINLPPLQVSKRRTTWSKSLIRETSKTKAVFPLPPSEKINVSLSEIKPLRVVIPKSKSYEEHCYNHYLVNHHYLGFSRTVGENLKYLDRRNVCRTRTFPRHMLPCGKLDLRGPDKGPQPPGPLQYSQSADQRYLFVSINPKLP